MTRQDIKGLVLAFAEAGRRVKKAGFDGVEFLAGHGELINQFLSPYYNRRTDEYGGSFENRLRFLMEIIAETKKMVGAKAPALVVPGEGATPEQVAAYRKATGVPDAPDGYSISWPEFPPGEDLDEAARGAWLTRMHQIGAPTHIVQAFATLYGQHVNTLHNGYRREAEAAGQELRRDWGPNYDANLGRANRAIQQYGGDALVDKYARDGNGRDPLTIRAWAKVGADLVEHGAMAGDTVGRVTPEEAQERMKTLQADLLKVPHGSDQAKALIDQIIQYTKIAQSGAK